MFPYNHLSDETLFHEALLNTDTNIRHLNSDHLLFDPFQLNGDTECSFTDDIDPDSHHYSKSDVYEYSEYYSLSKLNDVPIKHNAFSMCHLNIRSATKNASDFSHQLNSLKLQFDVIALTETWFSETNHEVIGFDDYNHICKYRQIRQGGGVSILFKKSLKFRELPELSDTIDSCESLFAEIELTNKNIIIGCLYRPPGNDISTFTSDVETLLAKLNKLNKRVYLLGDYNIDLLKVHNHTPSREFVDCMFSSSFVPLIHRPTRLTDTTATIIDNIFTNHIHTDRMNGIIPMGISDHFPIFTLLSDIRPSIITGSTILTRTINDQTIHELDDHLKSSSWDHICNMDNVEDACTLFSSQLQTAINSTMPLKVIQPRHQITKKPWITRGILDMIIQKNELYIRYKQTGDIALGNEYRKIRTKLTNVIRISEKDYHQKLLDQNKNNLSKLWKHLNSVISRKKTIINNTVFKHGNKEISEDASIANHFNNYFLNLPKSLLRKMPNKKIDPYMYMPHPTAHSLFLTPTDENEISEIIASLKTSSPGYDGIDMKIIKPIKNSILKPLAYICNLSFSQGKFPDQLKVAKIIPIHKKGDRSDFSNYRPISILPVFSKIIEKLAYKRISLFLDKNNILSENQFGFRQGRSTDIAIHSLVEKYYETIERNEYLVGLFIDFSKAFDTISHSILLKKLQYYGIRGQSLNWIEDYLYNRKQFVSYNGKHSQVGELTIGVPQGSILGPLLFLLYINDICNISDRVSFILFADDTNILISGSDIHEVLNILNNEMVKITDWIHGNKLSLNTSKTQYMIMSSPHNKCNSETTGITINGESISRVHSTKFLGIIIDETMSWKIHTEYICSKISKCIGILLRARQRLYGHTLFVLYNSLIKPYFTYCITIWGNTYAKYLNKLHLVQKRVIRIITRSEFCAHTAPLFKNNKTMTIYQLYDYFTNMLIYKALHCQLPLSICNLFTRNTNIRLSSNLRSVYWKKKICQFSITYNGPQLWNKLPISCKLACSLNIFKKLLRTHLFK